MRFSNNRIINSDLRILFLLEMAIPSEYSFMFTLLFFCLIALKLSNTRKFILKTHTSYKNSQFVCEQTAGK